MVNTRASNRLTRSSSQDVGAKPHFNPNSRHKPARAKATNSARRTKSTVIETNARASSRLVARNSVATFSAPSRPRSTTSSSTAARSARVPISIQPTLASTRSRRGTATVMPVAEVQPTRAVASRTTSVPSFTQSARKRKAEDLQVVAPHSKRQRTSTSSEVEEAEVRSLVERLKVNERALRKRELDVKKRETTIDKKEKSLVRKEARNAEKLGFLEAEKARATTTLKKLEEEVKALTATNAALEKKCCERNAEVATSPASSGSVVGTQWVLAQLEDQFQCSLCFEVMACPYQLNHGRCGHTFCALCLLKWCFAAVHRGCGYWHDALECPLCRAELPYTPDATPRHMNTFPFVPCRMADTMIKMLLDILKDAVEADANSRGVCVGASLKLDDRVIAWSQNGNSRVEWEARDAKGRNEMTMLVNNWVNLQGEDFITFKNRLESL